MSTIASLPDIGLIPDALKKLPQWVVWRYARVAADSGPRMKKLPISPHSGQYAKTTMASSWSDFATALSFLERNAVGLAGIGFVFTRNDPFVGVDLDDCRHPVTARMAPWAEAIVSELDSYTEVSPSGTGVKVILASHNQVPSRRKASPGIEVYSSDRYFTITGHALPGYESVHHRTDQITQVHSRHFPEQERIATPLPTAEQSAPDEQVFAKARNARNGQKFLDLWHGHLFHHNGNSSQADLSLCRILAFWCGPCPSQIDRLFRQSSLFREKWDQRHFADGKTYGEQTILAAIAEQNSTYYTWRSTHSGRK